MGTVHRERHGPCGHERSGPRTVYTPCIAKVCVLTYQTLVADCELVFLSLLSSSIQRRSARARLDRMVHGPDVVPLPFTHLT